MPTEKIMEELQALSLEHERVSRAANAVTLEKEDLDRSLVEIQSIYSRVNEWLDSVLAGEPCPEGKARALGQAMALVEAILDIHRARQRLLQQNIAAVVSRHADIDRRARELQARIGSDCGTA